MLAKDKKKKVIERFKQHPQDTGSAAIQAALLSERIKYLSDHLKKHKKDFHTRRGLLALVGRRRRLLDYLKKHDTKNYEEVLRELDLKNKMGHTFSLSTFGKSPLAISCGDWAKQAQRQRKNFFRRQCCFGYGLPFKENQHA